jgi:hypothetical protein
MAMLSALAPLGREPCYEPDAPVAQKVEHSVFHRGVVGSYPTRSSFSGQVTPSN